jgi:hypothetical protein
MTTARDLTNRLADLLRREHGAMADFILALADFDAKGLWRDLGHTSLFGFLRRELKLSAGAAQYRKTAAELVQRYPKVEAALRSGHLCLSSVCEVAKVLTPENAAEVLPRFYGLSSRDAAAVAVSIRPVQNPPTRDVVTGFRPVTAPPVASSVEAAVATPGTVPVRAPELATPGAVLVRAAPELDRALEVAAGPAANERPRPVTEKPANFQPLDAERGRLHLTVSRAFVAKLEAAKDALSHAMPGASSEEILEAGLDELISKVAKRRGLVKSPRKAPPPSKGDHVPAHVRREVWRRSGGRCEWVLESGERCGSTKRVEVDHVDPRALGGPPTIENTRALCRPHNLLAARQVFGDQWMDRFTRVGSAHPVRGMAPGRSGDQAGPP